MKDDILLGKETEYKSEYDQSLIYPIERAGNRAKLEGIDSNLNQGLGFYGFDLWTGYEISWLNQKGKPQVAIAEFIIPCDSKSIVESKSFKLYLNSFNNTRFDDATQVLELMQKDLSQGFGADIDVRFYSVEQYPLMQSLTGHCIDDEDITVKDYAPTPSLLSFSEERAQEILISHLLKSNCPVTNQPDWATVIIDYRGSKIDRAALLAYIISYRNHDDFHEHCVEQIFTDLWRLGSFDSLTVAARYTRRGGLDINPMRSSDPAIKAEDMVGRLPRQ